MTKKLFLIILISICFSAGGYLIADHFLTSAARDKALAAEALAEAERAAEKRKAFNAQSFTLDNGLEVVLIENHRAPIVSHMMWYKVGAADEDWGNSGLAHFFEHLMFKGTQILEPGEYSRVVRALGGNDNAFTAQDFTAYFVNIATENLPEIMRMEADRMVNLNIPEEHFLSERNVILEERASRTDTNPSARLMETMRATLFPNHAYGVPVIGWREEIATLKYQEAMDFYAKWYAPNNAVLVVSGAISRDELEALAQEFYGSIPAKKAASGPEYSAPGEKNISYKDAQVRQPNFIRLCRTPSYTTDKAQALALDIATNILDGGSATRLYQSLVNKGQLANNISLNYSGFSKQEATLSISASPREGTTLEALEAAIDKEINIYTEQPPSDTEIQEAKDRLINSAIFARDSLQGPAYIFGQAITTDLSINDVEYWAEDIAAVPNDAIRAAGHSLSDSARCVNGYLLPETGDPALDTEAVAAPEATPLTVLQPAEINGGSSESNE
mgnify:FL=1